MTEHSSARTPMPPRELKSWINVVVKLSGAGLSFLLLIVLTRNMSTAAFTDFSVILAWIAIATTVASFSMPLVTALNIAEYLANDRFAEAKGVFLYALGLSTLFSGAIILICIILIQLGWFEYSKDVNSTFIWLAFLLPINTFLIVISGLLQGQKKTITAEMYINVPRPILVLLTIAVFWYLGKIPLNTSSVIAIYTSVSALLLLIVLRVSYFSLPLAVRHTKPVFSSRIWFQSASAMMAVALVAAFNDRIDIIMMSWLTGPDETAAYVVASRFFQTIITAIIAVLAVMSPYLAEKLSELHSGETLEINRMIQQTAATILLITILALIGFVAVGPFALLLFGGNYGDAYLPMIILASGLAIAALFGPAISVSIFIGETRIAFISLLFGTIINAGISYLLTPIYGATGAAIASAAGMLLSVLIGYLWLFKCLGLNASPLAHLYRVFFLPPRT